MALWLAHRGKPLAQHRGARQGERMRNTLLLCLASLVAACSTTPAPVASSDPVLRDAANTRIVAVGEFHDDPAHHAYQTEVLRVMADAAERDGAPLLLGMEMFQRPYQQPLDDYVAGEIDELEMLRRTEYYERWRFNHTLYAPLWRLAKERGVRVVGLNAERDIVRKIGRKGLDSLTAEERGRIAADIDLDVASHRKRILGVFSGGTHPMPEERLNHLYSAQTTWDETMAESAAHALAAAGPNARMLIVAGSMHIQERDAITGRLHRRVGGEQPLVIVLRTSTPEPREEAPDDVLGDHVVRLAPVDKLVPARLGVKLEDAEGGGVRLTEISEGGAAARAGMQVGDVILNFSLPGGGLLQVSDTSSLKYALDYVRPPESPLVRSRRNGRDIAMSLEILPPAPPVHP